MRQAGDLRLEAQSRLDFLLRKFELARLVLPDIRHAYLAAEIAIDSVFSRIHHGREALDLLSKFIKRVSCLVSETCVMALHNSLQTTSYLFVFRGNLLQAPIDMFEFVLDALKFVIARALYDPR